MGSVARGRRLRNNDKDWIGINWNTDRIKKLNFNWIIQIPTVQEDIFKY